MTFTPNGEHYQAMRAVDAARIAWSALPGRTARFVRRVHDGGPFEAFPSQPAAINQLIALCALLEDGLIQIGPADPTEERRPRPVRLTDRGRAQLAPPPEEPSHDHDAHRRVAVPGRH